MSVERTPWVKVFLLAGTILVMSLQVSKCSSYSSLPRDDSKVKELQGIILEITPFPDFREMNSRSKHDRVRAGFFKDYASNAPYNQVEEFYSGELTKKGWHLVEEEQFSDWGTEGRTLSFRKHEFLITLTHKGGLHPGKYFISYYWWPETH
jgi:hypothetical protein